MNIVKCRFESVTCKQLFFKHVNNLFTSLSCFPFQPLLDLRDSDIKKLGVVNSKDRARMMSSLATYKSILGQDSVGEW